MRSGGGGGDRVGGGSRRGGGGGGPKRGTSEPSQTPLFEKRGDATPMVRIIAVGATGTGNSTLLNRLATPWSEKRNTALFTEGAGAESETWDHSST